MATGTLTASFVVNLRSKARRLNPANRKAAEWLIEQAAVNLRDTIREAAAEGREVDHMAIFLGSVAVLVSDRAYRAEIGISEHVVRWFVRHGGPLAY